MICPKCKKVMRKTDIISIASEPNYREREGIQFECDNHVFDTTLFFSTNNEHIKLLLEKTKTLFFMWFYMLLFDYQYIEECVIKKQFKK